LLNNQELAMQLGAEGKRTAHDRFNIKRFTQEWKELFEKAIHKQLQGRKQIISAGML
jgi:hypothetical protein